MADKAISDGTRKDKLMKKLSDAGLSPVRKALEFFNPTNPRTMEVVDHLTQLLAAAATLSNSIETNAYIKKILKFLSYIFLVFNVFTSIKSLFVLDEDEVPPSEYYLLRQYYQYTLMYRSDTFNEQSVINMDLFRSNLPRLVAIKEIYEVSDVHGELKTVELQDFVKATLRSYAIVVVHNDVEFLLTFAWKSGKTFDIFGPSEEQSASLIASIAAALLQSLQKNLIEISGGNHYDYDDIHSLKLFDLEVPEFYDEYIFDNLFNALETSMEKKIKTGVLLYGPPGVSKTTTVKYILAKLNAVKIKISNDGYKAAKKILNIIKAPKVILIDDIDVINNDDKDDEVTALLDFLDSECYNIVIMVANTLNLSPVIIRSGRCDIKLECKPPSTEAREKILHNVLSEQKLEITDKEFAFALKNTNNMTHADLHNIVKTMSRYAISIKEAIEKVKGFIQQTSRLDD